MLFLLLQSLFLLRISNAASVSRGQEDAVQKYTIQMIGYSPTKHDDYVAVSRQAIPGYIVAFEPVANADRVHHMLLYGCKRPAGDVFWKGMQTCIQGSHILYAWARNAPNLVLPKNVGFSVGHENDGIMYFVLQVHYAQPFGGNVKDFSGVTVHVSQRPPLYFAAVMLFVSGEDIPPHEFQHQNNISCAYTSNTEIRPFAFRTHTHAMGRVVSAFYKHNGEWNKIGVRNPQWPQLFESIPSSPVIRNGDFMAATCRFDSSDKSESIPMGAMGTNEMCNFYMMFHWDAKKENPFKYGAICADLQRPEEFATYPAEGMNLLPSHPELEHHAHQSSVPFGVIEEVSVSKIGDITLGQVSGLSFDNEGNTVVFHRAGRVWDGSSFDQYNYLLDKTAINDDVILFVKFDGNQSRVVRKFGKNKFYMPHGIFVDKENFIYTTDVGSHTVAKWKINGEDIEQVWENGVRLVPDSDRTHFCKPSGVVRSGNRIYVSDGYCNSRVVELSLDGNRTNEFGLPGDGPGQFQLPHDIVVNSAGNLLVSDRENGRVQELSPKGEFSLEYGSSGLFSNIYSMDVYQDYIFMVPGRRDSTVNEVSRDLQVYAGRSGTGLIEFSFAPTSRSLGAPHVLRVCPTGDHIFVGDIAEGKPTLWKFKIQKEKGLTSVASGYMHSLHIADSTSSFTVFAIISLVLFFGFLAVIRKKMQPTTNGGFDRKGFKPLRTEETVGFISDASDSD